MIDRRWCWLFDLEHWLFCREQPHFNLLLDLPLTQRRWSVPRRLVSRLTRRIERRGGLL
jgi:hypothetical protein